MPAPLPEKFTPESFEAWLTDLMSGDPSTALADMEATMSPNYLRHQPGEPDTTFASGIAKIEFFRANVKKWVSPVSMLVQEGRKVAAQMTVEMVLGDGREQRVELMFMGTRDESGKWEEVTELIMPYPAEGK